MRYFWSSGRPPETNSNAVTWRCLDDWQTLDVKINAFDGQNWEANAASLVRFVGPNSYSGEDSLEIYLQ